MSSILLRLTIARFNVKPLYLFISLAWAVSAFAQSNPVGFAQTAASVTPTAEIAAQQQRITEVQIMADRRSIDALQQRLRKLNESGIPQNSYPLAKAQCWLDTAKTQYHENDRTTYIEESMIESQKIIRALEADKSAWVGTETPLISRSTRLRDDLWLELAKHKNNRSTLACNARTVACAEVRLVRAGHAEEQTGWRAAMPHVMMTEDALRRANVEAASCVAAESKTMTARTAPPVPQQPVVREVTK